MAGDFLIGDVAIHVTTSPGEAAVERCRENWNDGLRRSLVTLQRGLPAVEVLAENKSLSERTDRFEVEQFLALNLYELGKFAAGRKAAVRDLVSASNSATNGNARTAEPHHAASRAGTPRRS